MSLDCRRCPLSSSSTGTHESGCALRGSIRPSRFDPKELLFCQGTPARSIFLLRSGYVKLSTALSDGRSQGLRLGSGTTFIGIEAMTEEHYPYTAETVSEVDACVIRPRELMRLIESSPQLSIGLINSLRQELQQSHAMICSLGRMSSTERVAAFLVSVLQAKAEPQELIPLPLTRTDIAEMLGLTLETVSRILTRLSRDAVIDLKPNARRFRILDPARLWELSGAAPAQMNGSGPI